MTKTRRPSEKAFKAKAVALFLKANPDVPENTGLTICWAHYSPCTWANGEKGVAGTFFAAAPGYAAKTMTVSWGERMGWSVR